MKLSCSKSGPRSTCILRWGAEGVYYLVVGVTLFYSVCRLWVLYEGFGDMEAVFEGSEEAWMLIGVSALALAPTLFIGSFAMIWRACLMSLTTGFVLFLFFGELEQYHDLGWAIIAGMAPLTLVANGLVLARLRSVVILDEDRGVLTCRRHHFIGSDQRSFNVTDETAVIFQRAYARVNVAGGQGPAGPTRMNVHGKLGIVMGENDVFPLGAGSSTLIRDRGRIMATYLGLPFKEDTCRDADEEEIL